MNLPLLPLPNLNIGVYDGNPVGRAPLAAEFIRTVMGGRTNCAMGHLATDAEINIPELFGDLGVTHRFSMRTSDTFLMASDDFSIFLEHEHNQTVTIFVAGADQELANAELERIIGAIPPRISPANVVSLNVWYMGGTGPVETLKRVETPGWTEIERNYPVAVADPLTQLMKMERPGNSPIGRLILWYGAPGTGKTTALRAMAREWKDWCTMHYVSDAETLLSAPGYLLQVGGQGGTDKPWRLIVAEDSDTFLHADQGGSPALGRLLNFSDGILGQGTNTLFLLTTNEPVDRLHPAVIRAGRCLAQIEFTNFSRQEATAWLGDGYTPPAGPQTLAELIEYKKSDQKKIVHEASFTPIGQYI